jgi:MFS family permease
VLFVALGSLTYGYSASIIATTMGQPSFIAYFELDTRSNATQLTGAINGLFQTGGLFGALSCTKFPDWLGRRKALLLNAVITVIGGALQAGSVDIGMYIAMRFVTGWGIGRFSWCRTRV